MSIIQCQTETIQPDTGIVGGEPPVRPGLNAIPGRVPGRDLGTQRVEGDTAAVEALADHCIVFDLGNAQPTAVPAARTSSNRSRRALACAAWQASQKASGRRAITSSTTLAPGPPCGTAAIPARWPPAASKTCMIVHPMAKAAVPRLSGRSGSRTVRPAARQALAADPPCLGNGRRPRRRHDGCPCRLTGTCAMPDSGKPPLVEHGQRILAVCDERGMRISMVLVQGHGVGLTNARLKVRNDDAVGNQARFERIRQCVANTAATKFGIDMHPRDRAQRPCRPTGFPRARSPWPPEASRHPASTRRRCG